MKMKARWLGAALVVGSIAGCAGDVTDLGHVDDQTANEDGSGDSATSSGTKGTTEGGVVSSAANSGSGGTSDPGSLSGVGGSPEESVVAAAAVSGVGGASEESVVGAAAVSGVGGGPEPTVVVGSVGTTGAPMGGAGGKEGQAASSATGTGGGEATMTMTVTTGQTTGVGTGGAPEMVSGDCSQEVCPGLCFGTSCDGEWQCHPEVDCYDDSVAWCGCDGETFYAGSGCPDRPYVHIGACE